MKGKYRVGLFVPTLNAGQGWQDWLDRLRAQTLQPYRKLIIDSGSIDGTLELARNQGFQTVSIVQKAFSHGGTRKQGAEILDDCDILLYMTQDALLATNESIALLVSAFNDSDVAIAYGRQLPHLDASPFAAHARLFNYKEVSTKKTRADIPNLGLRTAFCSNSFAAYRRIDLLTIGGFAVNRNFGEDAHAAARIVLSGKAVQYVAEAQVLHSHNYSINEDFRRYLEIGKFHSQERWMIDALGKADGEGMRFIYSELVHLSSAAPWLIPSALTRSFVKYLGYRIGRLYGA